MIKIEWLYFKDEVIRLSYAKARSAIALSETIHISRSQVVYFFTMFLYSQNLLSTNHSRSKNARMLRFSPKCRSQLPP